MILSFLIISYFFRTFLKRNADKSVVTCLSGIEVICEKERDVTKELFQLSIALYILT